MSSGTQAGQLPECQVGYHIVRSVITVSGQLPQCRVSYPRVGSVTLGLGQLVADQLPQGWFS